jgi:pimeloyl-ACP methyl ester carboxylesterase
MTLHAIRRPRITIGVGLAICALVGALIPPAASTAQSTGGQTCQGARVRVTLAPAAPTRYMLAGWLCSRGRPDGKPVQILLSGLTYDHTYWDSPYQPPRYSYIDTALQRPGNHTVVFNVDRIGVGDSDRPPAPLVTVASEAWVAHQLVQALRHGSLGHTRYATVIGVGHSMGSAMWIYEAAIYHDVDALVLTSYLHDPNVAQQQAIAATLQPADSDPAFAARHLPAGYYTTVSGAATRIADFYAPGDTDPAMAATDEAFKQTATSGERASLDLARDPAYSRHITVPVLIVVGQDDALGCDPSQGLDCRDAAAICRREASDFSPATHLATFVLAGAGHSINLHRNAATWFAVAAAWINQAIAPSRQQPRPRADGARQTPPGTSPTAPPASTPCP